MSYYKHSELIDIYHVSLKTVHNWIDGAKAEKIKLHLHTQGSRTYIINNSSNNLVLESLSQKGKKYRNTLSRKVANPVPEFYELYSPQQILDMIHSLSTYNEIPRQYNYFDRGAENWSEFAVRLFNEKTPPNVLTSTINLVHTNLDSLDLLLEDYERVNIVDLGPGNALPVRELLDHLIKKGKLHRYIAIDISQKMLEIAGQNIKRWFGDRIKFEGHIRDITHQRFDDLLVDDMLDKRASQTINVALIFGGTFTNFREPQDALKVVSGSLGINDLLMYTDKPDTDASRRYFDFSSSPGSLTLSPNHRFIFDLLNIDESLYDVEMGFNKPRSMRYVRIKLKVALDIEFKLNNVERVVKLDKGSTILLLRIWHLSTLGFISLFANAGFTLLQSSLTKDREYLLAICGINQPGDESS